MNVSSGGEDSQDFDLNLAPIIDAFVVLIAYLLVSASFLSLSVLDIGVSAAGEATAQEEPTEPAMNMEIVLGASRTLEIKVSGGRQNIDITSQVAPEAKGDFDIDTFVKRVEQAKKRWPSIEDASVTGEPGIKYKDMIKVIEALKKVMPKLYIAG